MKKITYLFFLLIVSSAYSQVKWMSLEQAVEAQKNQPRKILIDFYNDGNEASKIMEKSTFNHPVIVKYLNENYYPVRFNAESKENITLFGRTFSNSNLPDKKGQKPLHDFVKFMNVTTIPTTVFLDEQSMPITILQGNLTAKELEPYIPFIANDDYKKINTREQWENYQKKFKSTIKD